MVDDWFLFITSSWIEKLEKNDKISAKSRTNNFETLTKWERFYLYYAKMRDDRLDSILIYTKYHINLIVKILFPLKTQKYSNFISSAFFCFFINFSEKVSHGRARAVQLDKRLDRGLTGLAWLSGSFFFDINTKLHSQSFNIVIFVSCHHKRIKMFYPFEKKHRKFQNFRICLLIIDIAQKLILKFINSSQESSLAIISKMLSRKKKLSGATFSRLFFGKSRKKQKNNNRINEN